MTLPAASVRTSVRPRRVKRRAIQAARRCSSPVGAAISETATCARMIVASRAASRRWASASAAWVRAVDRVGEVVTSLR